MSINFATVATHFLERLGLSQSTVCADESTLLPLLQQYGRPAIDTLER